MHKVILMAALAVLISPILAQNVKRPKAGSLLKAVARRGEADLGSAAGYIDQSKQLNARLQSKSGIPGEKSRAAAAVAAGSL
jgi:hypothetical protein